MGGGSVAGTTGGSGTVVVVVVVVVEVVVVVVVDVVVVLVVVVGGGSVVVVVVGVVAVVVVGSGVPADDATAGEGTVVAGTEGERRGTVVVGVVRAGDDPADAIGTTGTEVPAPFMNASLAARWRESSINSTRPRPSQCSRSRPSSMPSEVHSRPSSASPM